MATTDTNHYERYGAQQKAQGFGRALDTWANEQIDAHGGTKLDAYRRARRLLVVDNSREFWATMAAIDDRLSGRASRRGEDLAARYRSSRRHVFNVIEQMIRAEEEADQIPGRRPPADPFEGLMS